MNPLTVAPAAGFPSGRVAVSVISLGNSLKSFGARTSVTKKASADAANAVGRFPL